MDYMVFKIYERETEAVLQGLRIADCMNFPRSEEDFERKDVNVPYKLRPLVVSDVLTCSHCNVNFADGLSQRNHYKLDWHRYNLKRSLRGSKPVSQEIFETLAGDVSSISGSDSETSTEDLDSDVCEPKKTKEAKFLSHRMKIIRHIKVFFENYENNVLSVYKCLLQGKKGNLNRDELVNAVLELMEKPKNWMVVVLGGGHFASAIFNNDKITHHKTFHSYTVRAKQGGSQSARDNKGGYYTKSAGASLRRYNEQALAQHVQETLTAWSEPLKECSLILYRATGPYNRNTLFGGKNPLLRKTDPRLRNIPFPTRRATFNEVKRIHDMLSSVEIYGSAEYFRNKFPRSPDKRTRSLKSKKKTGSEEKEEEVKDKSNLQKREVKARLLQRNIPGENIKSASGSSLEDEEEYELLSSDVTVSFQNLKENDDNVAECIENFRSMRQERKTKKRKPSRRKKGSLGRKMWNKEFERLRENLVKSCQNADKESLIDNLNIYNTLPERDPTESGENKATDGIFTKEDFINCLNAKTSDNSKNTLLHLAAQKCLPEFVTELLSAGADPTIKNKNKLTPYVVSGDKDTRNSFKAFATSFPEKYDYKKANIPGPLTKEEKEELEERKRDKKRLKRMKEKSKKLEEKQKEERKRFMALSDRAKCALAAERRILALAMSDSKFSRILVLSRCFKCGKDITGKVPFEYGIHRLCSAQCLRAHREQTDNHGVQT